MEGSLLSCISAFKLELVLNPPTQTQFATSVVVGGWYGDDADSGESLVYTGEGGNDLLGSRRQVAAQALERGNAALVGSRALGLPVRVTRKNADSAGTCGCAFIFDGLYDVTEWWAVRVRWFVYILFIYYFCLHYSLLLIYYYSF